MNKKLYDLTAPQKSIWLTEQFYKNTNINNVCGVCLSSVSLDYSLFEKAIKIFVQNNESFNIRLTLENGDIKQYFEKYSDFEIETVLVNSDEERINLENKINSKGFELLNSPLFKFTIFKYPDGHGGFILNESHIISDSWTTGIVGNEISKIYINLKSGLKTEKEKELSYSSFMKAEQEYKNSEKFKKDKEYWENIFETIPEIATIPSFSENQNTNSCKAKRFLVNIDSEKLNLIKAYVTKNKISLYNLFMGVFSLYLGRVSNLDEFVIGTPILNRTNFKEKQITGMFINTLPLKFNLNHEQKFTEFLSKVAKDSMGLLRHQRYSYNYILEDLRKKDSSIPGLYNVLFSYQITKMTENIDLLPYEARWVFNESISDDLDIHMFEWSDSNNLQIAYDYRIDKYSEEDISMTHERILHILDQILDNENILLKEIEIVTEEEKNKILYEFNNTKADYPKDKTISQLFEEQVEKTPDNIAVVFEDQKLTYRELNEKANQLANYLVSLEIGKKQPIAVILNRSIDLIISMLAIIKSGNIYLPISTEFPMERINYILENSKTNFIITSSKINIDIENNFKNINIDNFNYNKRNKKNLNNNINVNSGLYLIYTSGSTGNPKGVEVSHKNLNNFIHAFKHLYKNISNTDKLLASTNICFDVSIFEFFISLLNGVSLYLYNENTITDIFKYCETIIKNKITMLYLPPNILNDVYEILIKNNYSNLNKLLLGVEPINSNIIKKYYKLNPNIKIINAYGPTETTICATAVKVSKELLNKYKIIPIGTPLNNLNLYVLDKNYLPVPIGIPGELYIEGDNVSNGYFLNQELTKKNFITLPFTKNAAYKTGDIVKWNQDGNISFIERKDSQVKINGHRIELKEIETHLYSYPNIEKCVILIKNNKIVAFFTASSTIKINALKTFLLSKLPAYFLPNILLQLESFKLTTNGKIDRKYLENIKIDNKTQYIAPKTDLEKKLVKIFEEILSIEKIGINDNFFELGGDSLSAIKLTINIYNIFNKKISVKEIFQAPTIQELSLILENSNTNKNTNIKRIKSQDYYKISLSQQNIYMATKISGEDSLIYNIPGGIIFDKKPNIEKLEKCFNKLIKRHESLRTYFETEEDNIVLKISDDTQFKIDISKNKIPLENLESEFKNFVKPFDLSKAPLLRTKLINLDNGKTVLFVDMHHIISDSTSLSIFISELNKLYNDEELKKIEFTYKDFAAWENNALSSDKFKKSEEYWVNQFKSDIPVLNMPTNYSRPAVRTYEGAKVYSNIDTETVNKINNICKELSITPYMLLLSIYYILLSKYTGQDDIIVGSPIVGRNFSELYNIIGMFVNTLPVRAKIDSNSSFREFLNHIKNICLENYKYQNYPFNELISKLNIKRDTSHAPLFDTIFTYQNNGLTNINFDGINSEFYMPDTKISKFDLSLEIVPKNDVLDLNFEYCTKLFTKQFIENLSNHYKNILNIVLDNLDVKICDICMLSGNELNKIVYGFNNTKIDYPKDKTISQLFEEQVEKTPDNIAVVFENKKLTYKELNEKANSLANFLRKNNVGRNDIVGIMVNRSLEMLIAILAVLKAGGTYIPIDPEYPQDRIEYMLNNSNAKILLTFEKLENKISFENKVFIELNNKKIYSLNKKNLKNINEPDDSCYIIYTSGSTGTPKGAILKHSNIINFIYGALNKIPLSKKDTIISITTISFDIFVLESLLPLLNGIKIIIASEKAQTDINLLNEICINNDVSIIQTTPSRMLSYTFDINSAKFIKKIKFFLIGGEPFNKSLLNTLKNNSNGKIYNMYGPTETAVWSSIKDLSNTSKITIGEPICNTQMYILDSNFSPVPIGVPGELYISGDGVCKGYFNNSDLNNRLFIQNPFIPQTLMYKVGDLCKYLPSGEIEYLERIDNQVKIRGLRIELGEIENKILEFPNIKKTCVIKQTINNRDFISAYFTITKRINISELRKYLSDYLPRYMVPSYFTVIEDFPYTPNGKIDKKALPLPKEVLSSSEEKYIAPKTDLQIKIANIFEDVLNINKIGINDNFFELGGDSILAMNLNIELKKITNDISYADIFKFPTVSKLENKINSSNNKNDFDYLKKDYEKYSNLLNNNLKIPKLYNLKYKKTGNIILTGATGFLGIHILDSFIKNEKGNIYCIIREETGLTASLKLQQKLHYYFGNKYDKLIGKRIFTITGDITKPGFGLTQEELLELSNNIDIIINSAAKVSHFGNYSDFYNINVRSVKYMLDFCKSFNKKFYQISTLSVSGNALETASSKQHIKQETIFNESNLYIGQNLENVYIRSKFETECLVLDSVLEGIDAYILRVGNLMPRYRDGVFQENIKENAYINRLLSFIKLGALPEYLKNIYLEFTPVDITANSIIKLITHPSENNRIFHLFNNNHVYLKEITKYLKQLNKNFKIIEEKDFKNKVKKILKNTKENKILNSLINDFDKDLHFNYFTDIIIESKNTIKYLEKIGFKWPKISKRYLNNFINLLRMVL